MWQPLVTQANSNTSNKSLSRISSGNHKRTWQGVSTELLPYLYKLHMVLLQIITPALMSMHHPWGSNVVNMLLDVIHLVCSRLMTSHHVTCHVTAVMCLFIINKKKKKIKKKRNIKSRKIDKRKRKMLVLMHIITLIQCKLPDYILGMLSKVVIWNKVSYPSLLIILKCWE